MLRRALVTLAAIAVPAGAFAATPIPAYEADRVALGGVDLDVAELSRFLVGFKSAVGATYHTAMVARSDPKDRPGGAYSDSAVDYVDQIRRAWRGELNARTSIIIVLAVENRGIAVHPGSAWARIGFERGVIKSVIDGSGFGVHARAGDYPGAIQSLVESIDDHLKTANENAQAAAEARAKEFERLRGEVDAEAIKVRESLAKLRKRLQDNFQIAEVLLPTRVVDADAAIPEALALTSSNPLEAHRALRLLADDITNTDKALSRELDRRSRASGASKDLQKQLVKLRGAATEVPSLVGSAKLIEKKLGELDVALAEKRNGDALNAAAMAQAVAAKAQADVEHARWVKRFFTYFAPLIGLLLLLVLLLIIRIVRGQHAATAWDVIGNWERSLNEAADTMIALENDHPLLFAMPNRRGRFSGETERAYDDMASGFDDLSMRYGRASKLVEDASAIAGSVGPLSTAGFKNATAMLTSGDVTVGTEDAPNGKLFGPRDREITVPATRLLADMDLLYAETNEKVKVLQDALRAAPAKLRAVRQHLADIESCEDTLTEHGVSSAALSNLRVAHQLDHDRLREAAGKDPMRVAKEADGMMPVVQQLVLRANRVGQAVSAVEGEIGSRLDELAKRLRTVRAQDKIAVAEPGFEPDEMIERARMRCDEAMRAAESADADRATDLVREAKSLGGEAESLITATCETKENLRSWLEETEAASAELKMGLAERLRRIEELQESHHDDALYPVLDNVDEAATALGYVRKCLQTAAEAGSESEQRYLAARELVARAKASIQKLHDLYAEVESKAEALAKARRETEEALIETDGHAKTIDGLLASKDAFASEDTRKDFADLARRIKKLLEAIKAKRPHWPQARAESLALAGWSSEVLILVQREKDEFDATKARHLEVAARRNVLMKTLSGSDDDRTEANECFREAQVMLTEADKLMSRPPAPWDKVLRMLDQADDLLSEADTLARVDLEWAEEARGAVAKAEAAVNNANDDHHLAASGLAEAKRQLKLARRHLANKDYEKACKVARDAQWAADLAKTEARAEASRASRKRARRNASSSLFMSWGSSGSSPARSSFGGASSHGSSSSGFGTSSFGSSFSSSSTSSSTSSGSSFSSSSSGSSFGSSSGGSSW